MATNLPLGTYVQDGVRSGPLYTGQVPSSLLPFNTTEVLSYSSYTSYGPGVLYSPQYTWNITPNVPATGYTTLNNLVAVTAAANFTQPGYLTLRADNNVTTYVASSPSYIQFDWPRIVTVTIGAANLNAQLRVTIFGYDWYGVPLQHTYVVQDRGTYPTITLGSGGGLNVPAKAFYSVTNVYVSGGLSNNATISLGAADVFGLPYLINDEGDLTSVGWGTASDLQDNSALVSSPVSGTATLVGGTVTVSCNAVTASSTILLTYKGNIGATNPGSLSVSATVANTSFTILSSNNADTSAVAWTVLNPSGQYSASGVSAAMIAGVVTIPTSQVQANSIIQLTLKTFGTAHGAWYVSAIVPGVSFTVTSTNNNETSTVSWAIMPDNWVSGTSANLTATGVFVNAPTVTETSNILLTYSGLPDNPGVLSAPAASIEAGVGFTIVSSSDTDTSTVNWTITQSSSGLTQGTATLVAGTTTVLTTAVATNSVILLTDNTLNNPASYVSVSNITAGTSFVITAQADTDVSTVNWQILPAQFFLPTFISPVGALIPADQTFSPTATTGDVRGLYAPSTPSNGSNVLRVTYYVPGADIWINQVANTQDIASLNNQPMVGVTVNPLTAQDLYGLPQFYTGSPS